MPLENFRIKRFLLRVKKKLYMYMYLSDRIRRMFLSGACPQNLSPKKPLSIKDQRFLQKTLAGKKLSRALVKQQKHLYEKHIGLSLEQGLFHPGAENSNLTKVFVEQQKKQSKQSWLVNQECGDNSFPNLSFTFFTQSIFVKKSKGFYMHALKGNQRAILGNPNGNNSYPRNETLQKKTNHFTVNSATSEKHSLFFDFNKDPLAKKTIIDPLASYGNYTNCRYLYDHESLKTCIVPQIFKNQKPASKAKTLLHERKKIALLYGQLAKKDILSLSRKAFNVAGFFEDNMFALLESRVDVCVFRAGFSKTIAGARQLIRNGFVLVNGKPLSSCKRKAFPGDYFTFAFKQAKINPYRHTTLELYNLCLSSNFLRERLFLNKMAFFREKGLNQEQYLTPLEKGLPLEKGPRTFFFVQKYKEKYKPGFCYSLYWGFFLYKLYKKPGFSCFFETLSFSRERAVPLDYNTLKKKPVDCPSPLGDKGHNNQRRFLQSIISPGFFSADHGSSFMTQKENHKSQSETQTINLLNKPCKAEDRTFLLEDHKPLKKKEVHSKPKKNIVLLNLYTQYLLKNNEKLKTKHNRPFIFRKKISSSDLWAIWGQKPIHLEISHKTGAFIYMYKPQKVISSVCLSFKI